MVQRKVFKTTEINKNVTFVYMMQSCLTTEKFLVSFLKEISHRNTDISMTFDG